jgi:hypothetical protein
MVQNNVKKLFQNILNLFHFNVYIHSEIHFKPQRNILIKPIGGGVSVDIGDI